MKVIRILDSPRVVIGQTSLSVEREMRESARWLRTYDPDYAGGVGRAEFTSDPRRAKKFQDMAEALAEYRRVSTVHPVRDDGRPNRPLTAYSISIEDWDDDS